MSDERKDEAPAAAADQGVKRAPPTIDLDASEVSGDTQGKHDGQAARAKDAEEPDADSRERGSASPFVASLSGALAALVVLGAAWAAGMIGSPWSASEPASAKIDSVADRVGALTNRIARVEAIAARPPAPAGDPSLTGRTETLEASLASAREEIARVEAQLRDVTSALNELRSASRDDAASAAELAPLNERLARLEEEARALSAGLATSKAAAADDSDVRRLAVATALDAAVRHGEPFAAALAAAKQVATDPAALAPLDAFAAKGIPSEASYMRDIVPVLQRLADAGAAKRPAAEGGAGGGVLDWLQSGLAKLVRIERDAGSAAGDNPPASAAPAAAAVRRDDLAATRQAVAKLPQASDPQVQDWIKSVDARGAALSASHKFSAEALAAFVKSGQ